MRTLAAELDLGNRTVTLDAMHAQQETVRSLCQDFGAHYLVTAVKHNQPTILEDLTDMHFEGCASHETLDKKHGCIDRRRYWVEDLSDPDWNG